MATHANVGTGAHHPAAYVANAPTTLMSMDNETAALILQFLHQDSQDASASINSEGKQVEESDAQMAMRLFLEEEVAPAEMLLADHRMTRSLQLAAQLDGDACQVAAQHERIAIADRALCDALRRGVPPMTDPAIATSDDHHGQLIEELTRRYLTQEVEMDLDDQEMTPDLRLELGATDGDERTGGSLEPEPSTLTVSNTALLPEMEVLRCNSCFDRVQVSRIVTTPCNHQYCTECLQLLFHTAMADESLFPPRCCAQEVQLSDTVRAHLGTELVSEFALKAVEYSTPNRTYCQDVACGAFIPATQYVNCVAICALCSLRTCTTCKQAAHEGDCPNDPILQSVLDLARQEGWQRCQQCWAMVELNQGCYHMTCRCGSEFCYLCAARWKTCTCAHWDEHRLYERAVEINARNNPNVNGLPQAAPVDIAVAPPVRQAQQIGAIMNNLRANHECDHLEWQRREGCYQCEQCEDYLPTYIYECRQCQVMYCHRCRHHRRR